MALTGNKGEWSEPYALLKLLADGKLYLGGENFSKIKGLFYPILKVIRHEKERDVEFTVKDKLIIISGDNLLFELPIADFIRNAAFCFEKIRNSKNKKGAFEIQEIETFLSTFSITSLKAKSTKKNDITIQVEDPNSFLSPSLGFSIKSQLGKESTLVNSSGATQFTYKIVGNTLSDDEIHKINNERYFSNKIKRIRSAGADLVFEKVDNPIFKSNLQTVDYNFDKILSEMVLMYYSSSNASDNSVVKFIEKISERNSIGYDLGINSSMYELIMKKFLSDYALGMVAGTPWKREYQATGGYLIVREDGELICYHFYFTKQFEDYLFNNTKLDTPSPNKFNFGSIYLAVDGTQKMKLNLQIRFIK
jgi:type II restriction enzyme